jgi:hypothetical protein
VGSKQHDSSSFFKTHFSAVHASPFNVKSKTWWRAFSPRITSRHFMRCGGATTKPCNIAHFQTQKNAIIFLGFFMSGPRATKSCLQRFLRKTALNEGGGATTMPCFRNI